MPDLDIPPLLWLVGFQMSLYAVAWVVCATLLREDRGAVVHWGLFLLLIGAVLLLAGLRSDDRHWLYYNGANVLSLIAFALMRRGTERFMRLRSSDPEQAIFLLAVAGTVAALGADEGHASARIVLTYAGQGYAVLRTMSRIARPLRDEFGRSALWAIVVPGVLISLMLGLLATRQALDFGHPIEMHRDSRANYALMFYYLGGTALFNFGFMVMLTQRLVVALREASQRDALTGLFNRRAMDQELDRHWRLHRRHGRPFAVLLMDIDHFKRINDSHGHGIGDLVLVDVAHALQREARATDCVARTGGEEFLVLLPDTGTDAALRLAERLRATIQGLSLVTPRAVVRVTASIGVATVGAGDAGVAAVVARADEALYRAKAEGRNRCALADDGAPLTMLAVVR